MPISAWDQLLAGAPWFSGAGRYPIEAYSEFLPPPRPGCKPYGHGEPPPREGAAGWRVSPYEEELELRPGLQQLAVQIVSALAQLGQGKSAHGIARNKLHENPYWPPELAERAGQLEHERYVVLLPLALSRTQDDKGRVRWTLFGSSEQGPSRGFWKGFSRGPRRPWTSEEAEAFFLRLLETAYGLPRGKKTDLGRAGFRILPDDSPLTPLWKEGRLPHWTQPFLWEEGKPLRGVKFLLTFRPFSKLPATVRKAYLAGNLHLLPFPGSLLFWGVPCYHRLQADLLFAHHIPLLQTVIRHEGFPGMRVPQSGWMHEHMPGGPAADDRHGPIRNSYKRTHRWARLHRHEDELAVPSKDDKVAHVLFSTAPSDLGLYGKPMGRNAQVWTHDYRLIVDGPSADAGDLERATRTVCGGGLFGYRFHFPAMRVGHNEVYWQRPLVACRPANGSKAVVIEDAPLGYLTAYRADEPDLARPVELWPSLDQPLCQAHQAATAVTNHGQQYHPRETMLNLRKLLETHSLLAEAPLPRSFARQLLTLRRNVTLDAWLDGLPRRIAAEDTNGSLTRAVQASVASSTAQAHPGPEPLTYGHTARRSFEVAYWKTIAKLATGRYVNKDNADCVRDPVTQACLAHHQRDLEALGDYLLSYYARLIRRMGMSGKALAGELPFQWRTHYDFSWMGGWLKNQNKETYERNLMVMIPGRDRSRAVIMGDHYDTAYMVDHYEPEYGGNGARLAAAGADDNHSATATLMLGAPLFLNLSRQGRLACDVWLVHLTGEEFPSDCLGARHLTQRLVEGTLKLHLPDGRKRDLSKTRVQGVYVLDMVAHNNDHDPDVFQIAPGTGPESMWLAYQAHVANAAWNELAPKWNQKASRHGKGRGVRSADPRKIPDVALHPQLSGEVRPPYDPRSTLYNTDGQIFSDAGVPVVLFMENYDINRTGYHDSHDTMENIDLDYGSAVAAIAIETVARAATEKPPR